MKAIFTLFRQMTQHIPAARGRLRPSAFAAGNAGGMMIEAVVAVSLMTVVGTAVLSGLSTTHISGAKTERQSIGENISRNLMAHVFSEPYDSTLTNPSSDPDYYLTNCGDAYFPYPASLPAGYSICIDTEPDPNDPTNTDVQKVVTRVKFEGSQVFRLESIKSQ